MYFGSIRIRSARVNSSKMAYAQSSPIFGEDKNFHPRQYRTTFGNISSRTIDDYSDETEMNDPDAVITAPVDAAAQALHNQIDVAHGFYISSTGFRLTSAVCEYVLAHPFTVMRRQCQVHETAVRYHLLPITLVPVIIKLQGRQGIGTLWKGIGSIFIVKGLAIVSEDAVSQMMQWPKEISSHLSTKKFCQHVLLKMIGAAIMTPFYATSLIQTVQSDIASEKPGILDCVIEGIKRIVPNKHQPTSHLLPFWMLMVPTAIHGVCHYAISTLVQRATHSFWKMHQERRRSTALQAYVPLMVLGHCARGNYDAAIRLLIKLEVLSNQEATVVDSAYAEPFSLLIGHAVAEALLFPAQTIIHRLYVQGTRTIIDNLDNGLEVTPVITRYVGPIDCLHTIVSEEGASGLFKGFGAMTLQYALHLSVLKLAKLIFDELYARRPKASLPS